MQLHQFSGNRKRISRRIARGGKRGTYSGRGQKGQKSRAGRRMRPAMRDLIARIPKRRGFRNKPHSTQPFVIPASKIARLSGAITVALLKKEGIVPKRHNGEVKIIGVAELKKPITFTGIKASASFRALVERAGGKVV